MLHTLTSQLGLVALLAMCVLVLIKGGPAERGGAVLVAVTWSGLLVWQGLTLEVLPEVPLLVSDAVLAVGFLILAIRHASLWLGAAMMLQAGAFTLHLLHLTGDMQANRLYVLSLNMVSASILGLVAGAAVLTWVKRTRAGAASRETAEIPSQAAPLTGP